jgi:hypothetical protein
MIVQERQLVLSRWVQHQLFGEHERRGEVAQIQDLNRRVRVAARNLNLQRGDAARGDV